MKVYFQIAERSLSYAKIHENADKAKKSCRFFPKIRKQSQWQSQLQ